MRLIKNLGMRKANSGYVYRYGLFYCEYCKKEVEKPYHDGLKYKSCGCTKVTHESCGGSNTKLYKVRTNIKSRCCNPNNERYNDYGGRGIVICDEWLKSFIPFREWALSQDNLLVTVII